MIMENLTDGAGEWNEFTGDATSTNLIINYLPQTLGDEEFRSLFINVGPIKSSKIVRDKATGYSYGFGFVDFERHEDATRAVETLSGLQLQNKRIKVAFARPGGENIKGANLYLRNLPTEWRETELNKMCEPYGTIIQSRVLIDLATRASRRVGFVLYDTKEQADNAIKCLNGKTPEGCTEPIAVKFADDNSKKMRQQQGPPMPYMGIPGFNAPGPMRNNSMNRFGQQRFNPMGNNFCQQGMPNQNQGGYTLFVYNIGFQARDSTLWQLLAPFGTVQKVNVMMDHEKKQCKGYGFVTMTNYQEALNAITCLNGYFYQGRALQVSFKSPQQNQGNNQQNQQTMNPMNPMNPQAQMQQQLIQ